MIENKIKVSTNDLKPFFSRLASNVHSSRGILIAKKGTLIDSKILSKFKLYEIDYVYIESRSPTEKQLETKVNYEILERFENIYTKKALQMQHMFEKIKNTNLVSTEELMTHGKEVLSILKQDSDIFNYLSSLSVTDDVTFYHCLNTSLICQIFGNYLKLSKLEIDSLATAGILHDIGKVFIDPRIIYKGTTLTPAELNLARQHVIYSYRTIKNLDMNDDAKMAILMHHERLDGSGYPLGLKDDKIPKLARILAIVDIYDAMTQKRPYHDKMVPLYVLQYLKENSLTKLDYVFTNKFIEFASQSFVGNLAHLSDGTQGEIVYINQKDLYNPLVKRANDTIDLTQSPNLNIIAITTY